MTATPDDWLIRGVAGEVYPCRADIFEQTYEEVGDDSWSGNTEARDEHP